MMNKQPEELLFLCPFCKMSNACSSTYSFSERLLLEKGEGKAEEKNLICLSCRKELSLGSEHVRQLQLFIALYRQIKESEKILDQANISIRVRREKVSLPYRLLLHRYQTSLTIEINHLSVDFYFPQT